MWNRNNKQQTAKPQDFSTNLFSPFGHCPFVRFHVNSTHFWQPGVSGIFFSLLMWDVEQNLQKDFGIF